MAAERPAAWTPELRRLEREYDEAKRAYSAAHDGFEEGLLREATEAWERFSAAVEEAGRVAA